MLGWFKRKPRLSRAHLEAGSAILDTVQVTIGLQLRHVYPSEKDSVLALMNNKKASGYIFGFHDGMLQAFRQKQRNEDFEAGVFRASYEKLFGRDGGGDVMMGGALALQSDHEFAAARNLGGNEAMAFMRDQSVPCGLLRILVPGFNP